MLEWRLMPRLPAAGVSNFLKRKTLTKRCLHKGKEYPHSSQVVRNTPHGEIVDVLHSLPQICSPPEQPGKKSPGLLYLWAHSEPAGQFIKLADMSAINE